jgi:ketosteroid isomerase-like protein
MGEFAVDWVTNDGASWRFEARSLTHWRRNAQGEWEIAMLMFQDLSDS